MPGFSSWWDDSTTPDALRRELRGELDLIVLKALAAEPEERYGSPAELARDLERYLDSLQEEERVRVDAALAAGDDELAVQWRTWCRGARGWLRNLCLGIDEELPESR